MQNRLGELISEWERLHKEALPLRKLEELTGVGKNTLSAWSRNDIKQYNKETAAALCLFFGVGPGEFFVLGEEHPEGELELVSS